MLTTASVTLVLILLLRAEGFKFTVKRELKSTKALEPIYWSQIELTGSCEPGKEITATVEVPFNVTDNFSGISIYFANELKNILRVDFEGKMKGTYYTTPYRVEKKIEGNKDVEQTKKSLVRISGVFDSSWLPSNCTKISASIIGYNKTYNYYGIQNSDISIEDLQVVEEYKNFNCGLLVRI